MEEDIEYVVQYVDGGNIKVISKEKYIGWVPVQI